MKLGTYFLVPREMMDALSAREAVDALRYERAIPASQPPEGFYMFQKIDPDTPPAHQRWTALGAPIAAVSDDPETLRTASPRHLPTTSSPPLDTFDLIGALQGLMEACDEGGQTPKQKEAFNRAAEVLNSYVRVGLKVFNKR